MTTLFINRSDSRCGACNRTCLPHEPRHETPCGWDGHEGCGAEYTALSTNYPGTEEAVRAMRPDLPWVGPNFDLAPYSPAFQDHCAHEWIDRQSDVYECLHCGLEGSGPAPTYSPAYQCTRPDCTEPANQGHLCAACERRAGR